MELAEVEVELAVVDDEVLDMVDVDVEAEVEDVDELVELSDVDVLAVVDVDAVLLVEIIVVLFSASTALKSNQGFRNVGQCRCTKFPQYFR